MSSRSGLRGQHHDQHWPWWPLLPLYPYGHRPTLVRELIPDQVWSFEQLQGVWYVAVPIRMTVVKVEHGLMLYSPIAPTKELLNQLSQLESKYGEVCTIVLPTSSGLEHKIPLPAMARAFPAATIWVSDQQWSFPLSLPSTWLGFPGHRTRTLFRDGLPHGEQLAWLPLGPLNLGLGTFFEVACLDRSNGCLLVTDALVSIQPIQPEIFELDPTPLLFHARDHGSEPLTDTPANRQKGWKRIVLFANYFRPASLEVSSLRQAVGQMFAPLCRNRRSHFGFYPFQWNQDWEGEFFSLLTGNDGQPDLMLAPVLERLVFPRERNVFTDWLRGLANCSEITHLISCHYHAPLQVAPSQFDDYADSLLRRDWAVSERSWSTLAAIDQLLLRLGIVPPQE